MTSRWHPGCIDALTRQGAASMPKTINVVVWNVRNLTREYRKGGWDGLSSKRRVDRVGYTLQGAFDDKLGSLQDNQGKAGGLVLLMETGKDAMEHVVTPLLPWVTKGLPLTNQWQEHVSDQTGVYEEGKGGSQPETYTVLANQKIFDEYPINLRLMDNQSHHRSGCVVTYNNQPFIAVIHAPSPSHNIEVRLAAIKGFAKAVTQIAGVKQNGIVLCGDFNIERENLQALEEELNKVGFELKGPRDAEEDPLATTLKQINSQLQGQGHESQPYDLVWEFRGSSQRSLIVVNSVQLLRPSFNHSSSPRANTAIGEWLAEELSDVIGTPTENNGISAEVIAIDDTITKKSVNGAQPNEETEAAWQRVDVLYKTWKGLFKSKHNFSTTDSYLVFGSAGQLVKKANKRLEATIEDLAKRHPRWVRIPKGSGTGTRKLVNDILATYSNVERCLGLVLGARNLMLEPVTPGSPMSELEGSSASSVLNESTSQPSGRRVQPARKVKKALRKESSPSISPEEAAGVRLLISDHLGIKFQMSW
jgi:hypothetical protein